MFPSISVAVVGEGVGGSSDPFFAQLLIKKILTVTNISNRIGQMWGLFIIMDFNLFVNVT